MEKFRITYDFLANRGLVNTSGCSVMCYIKEPAIFGPFALGSHKIDGIKRIPLPYDVEYNRWAKRKFWDLLDEEQYELANSFSERHGFFQYLRETGLIEIFYDALDIVTAEIISKWETEYDVHPDWENIPLL